MARAKKVVGFERRRFMSYRPTAIAAVLAIACLPVVGHTQQETIPEAIARGATGRFRTAPSGLAPSVSHLLQETDLIIRGIVGDHKSYLSSDQTDVYTDYALNNITVFYRAEPFVSARPGARETLAVTQLGGTVTVNGVEFKQIEDGLPALEAGSDGLFLLCKSGNRYFIAGTFYGAFGIATGKLLPLTKVGSFAPEYRDIPATEAVTRIVAQARSLRK
jgi:hypothetical protein